MSKKDVLITPTEINALNRASEDLQKLIRLIQEDSMTFSHLRNLQYIRNVFLPHYNFGLKVIDIREVETFNIIDFETDKFIITFIQENVNEGYPQGCYKICTDILLSNSAEVEITSGYMDEVEITPNFSFIFN